MFSRRVTDNSLALALCAGIISGGFVLTILAQTPPAPQEQGRPRSSSDSQQEPAAKTKAKDEEVQASDDVLRIETNLTTIFFSAEDKHKRYISTLKLEDIRIFEDGQPQQVFTFQRNTELPLSLAVLIDTSRSEVPTCTNGVTI